MLNPASLSKAPKATKHAAKGNAGLLAPFNDFKPGLIDILDLSLKNDISLPCFSEALSFINQISSISLSTKLIQAQRNQFGSHKINTN